MFIIKKVILLFVLAVYSLFVLVSCSDGSDDGHYVENSATEYGQVSDNSFAQVADNSTVFGAFTAQDLDGNMVTDSVFAENKLTMVNVWATFCSPCISEMPALGELAAEYSEKGVGIVGIPVDITDELGTVNDSLYNEALDIVAQTNADYTHIVPTASMFSKKLASVFSVPETIFVDSDGKQVGESYLGARSKEQWIEIIDELLGEVQ